MMRAILLTGACAIAVLGMSAVAQTRPEITARDSWSSQDGGTRSRFGGSPQNAIGNLRSVGAPASPKIATLPSGRTKIDIATTKGRGGPPMSITFFETMADCEAETNATIARGEIAAPTVDLSKRFGWWFLAPNGNACIKDTPPQEIIDSFQKAGGRAVPSITRLAGGGVRVLVAAENSQWRGSYTFFTDEGLCRADVAGRIARGEVVAPGLLQ